jgi:hypothetical protein
MTQRKCGSFVTVYSSANILNDLGTKRVVKGTHYDSELPQICVI